MTKEEFVSFVLNTENAHLYNCGEFDFVDYVGMLRTFNVRMHSPDEWIGANPQKTAVASKYKISFKQLLERRLKNYDTDLQKIRNLIRI